MTLYFPYDILIQSKMFTYNKKNKHIPNSHLNPG